MSNAEAAACGQDMAVFHERVGAALRRGGRPADTVECRPLSGGAMQEMWSILASEGGRSHRYVLRRLVGAAEARAGMAIDLAQEAQLLQAAARAGVTTPEVIHVLEPEDELGHGYLMVHVTGETIPPKILKSEALAPMLNGLAAQCGQMLAKIHAMPLEGLDFLEVFTPQGRVERLRRNYLETGPRRPVFEYALRWLEERAGDMPARRAMLHGDFRHGNLMLNESGIAAVLDWELAHGGDPIEDLGWLCTPSWRFGRIEKPVGGFGEIEDLRQGYIGAGGEDFSDEQLRFWIVYGAAGWGVSCRSMATWFSAGGPVVEWGVIGRRTSEAEIDILTLLQPRGATLC